ncbi:toll/interleukin-1 receptor domain-containing protein [Parafrankia sp. EUN1f]|uniref:toll/interleukin-1 receptor domain-containing protein n=1 Tax=Parafrankia sp. EUN1f TaxID=102897 RepID=UPI0001C44AC9|nr:toll/interleukin-1 receptor domain-containing protein [Parafrankia sp. EUN1f]EFC83779.1 TIR protein [Parafrankia sp. EUN1f]
MTGKGSFGAAATAGAGWDYFVSYTQADRRWAEWIAWQLEETGGFRVLLQAWDMVPGTNIVVGMQDGLTRAERTIAVLSDAYTYSLFSAAEWQATFSADPSGFKRKLLVVRVEDCAQPGLLGQVVSFDLFGMPEAEARDELVRWARLAVTGDRAKPPTAPTFPGVSTAPVFPGDAAQAAPSGAGDAGTHISAGRDIYGPGYAAAPTTYNFGPRDA